MRWTQVIARANDEHQHCIKMGCNEIDFMNKYSRDAFAQVTQHSPAGWEDEWLK